MLLSFNFAPKFWIYTMPGNRPGEGGRVRRKAELPSSRIQICLFMDAKMFALHQDHNPTTGRSAGAFLCSLRSPSHRWWQYACNRSCLLVVLQNLQYQVKLFCAPGNLPSIHSACGNTNSTALAVEFSCAGSS